MIWLSKEIVEKLGSKLVGKIGAIDAREIVTEVRAYLKNEEEKLKFEDIPYFVPDNHFKYIIYLCHILT